MAETGTTLRERAVELAAELIEYRTVANNPGQIDACMDRIAEFFSDAGIGVTRHRHDGVPSLVASLADTDAPDVMFHGHLDVVPAPERQFTPRIDGEHMYGRGAADMKGGLAAGAVRVRDERAVRLVVRHVAIGGVRLAVRLARRIQLMCYLSEPG